VAAFITLTPVFTTQAQIAVPDSTRPGALRPEETGRQIIPPQPPEETFEPPGAVLEIPPVIDRPFEIDEGPKVGVTQFRLVDAVDMPEFGVSLAELNVILQEAISAKPEGFTVGQLQEVADQITVYYRDKGLILAQAVVPVQTVEGGIVNIQVFVGRLGRVLVEGNTMYSEAMLTTPFADLIGQPVTQQSIESAILELTDYPGLSVFGVFQPGQLVGTADISLSVQEEDHFDFAYRVDNHGLPETGRGRFRPTFEWNNITGAADRLAGSLQQTYHPKNNYFYSVDYDRYLGWGVRGGVGLNRNSFDVGGDLAAQEIEGETKETNFFLEKAWMRSRQWNLSTRFGLYLKDSATTTRGRQTNHDKLSVFTLSSNFDNVDTRFLGINFVTLEVSRGVNDLFGAMGSANDAAQLEIGERPSRQGGPEDPNFASGQFTKVFMTASRLQTISSSYGLSLLARGEIQWSDDLLVPLEQYSVGGPDNVRAYPPAQQLLDRAGFYSFELIKTLPFIGDRIAFGNRSWGELIQLSVFYDFAVGRLNKPLSGDKQEGLSGYVNFRGAGVQMRFTLPGMIESRIMFASDYSDAVPDNGRPNQLWGDLTYRF
jgi:hemolysin activation/secretion protein